MCARQKLTPEPKALVVALFEHPPLLLCGDVVHAHWRLHINNNTALTLNPLFNWYYSCWRVTQTAPTLQTNYVYFKQEYKRYVSSSKSNLTLKQLARF